MQRYGVVYLKGSQQKLEFAWEESPGYERLDIIDSLGNYNIVDTTNCVAAYYNKSKEYFYGDIELIRKFLETRLTASNFNAKRETSMGFENGVFAQTESKNSKELGYHWMRRLENGLLVREEYENEQMKITVLSIKSNTDIQIEPINIANYIIYDIADGIRLPGAASDESDYYSLEYLKATYHLDHIEDNDFVVVQSLEEANSRLKRFFEADTKVKAIDIETTGTQTGMFGNDVITGVSLSFKEDESTYYPFRQEKCPFNLPISYLRNILDAVNKQPKDVVIVAYNGKFEIEGFWKESKDYISYSEYARNWDTACKEHGLEDTYLRVDADPFFASIICNPVFKKKGVHTLKSEAQRADGKFYLELDDVFKDKKNIRFNVLPPEIIRYYACPDTPNTIKVYKRLMSLMPKSTLGIFKLESKMIYVTAENEFYGMRTQKQELIKLIESEEYDVKVLGDFFKKVHHTNKNINSPDVRRDIFYNKLRCPVEVRTNKGLPSTSNVALKRIVELGTIKDIGDKEIPKSILGLNGEVLVKGEDLIHNRYPSLVVLEKYAKAQKQLGAYKRIQRTSLRDRVMFYMNQYGAATGRRTSDAHQYSDGMKKLIVADSPDHYLWSADFKQIELRLLAYRAGQEDLIKLESDPNVDVHRAITSIITGQPIWSISAAERKRRKSTNFGVVYMMSGYGLAKRNAGPAYTHEDYIEALTSINDFYAGLPKINQFVVNNEKTVREKGYMETAFGRRREFKEILDPTYPESKKKSLVRAANNMPVQGFGADLLKIVELQLKDYIHSKGWDEKVDCNGVMLPKVRLMLSIHDEVLVSTHKSIPIAAIITMFKECMELKVKGAPPFFAAPAMVNTWYDGKLDKYELDLNYRDEIVEAYEKDGTELIHPETYLEELETYRSKRLNTYMEGLVQKYKTVDEVANHVRHDEFTHTLISVYIKDGEKFEHMEAIRVATERYMEKRLQNKTYEVDIETEERRESEESLTFEELEECINFDENGEAIFDEEEEEDDLFTVSDHSAYDNIVERSRVLYSFNQAIIDFNDFKPDSKELSKAYDALVKFFVPNGQYTVLLMVNGQIVSTGCSMNYMPKDVDNAIQSVLQEVII